jgi:hypothetical protein
MAIGSHTKGTAVNPLQKLPSLQGGGPAPEQLHHLCERVSDVAPGPTSALAKAGTATTVSPACKFS